MTTEDSPETVRYDERRSQEDFKRSVIAQAKAAGIRDPDRPVLEWLDRRRARIWIAAAVAAITISTGLLIVSIIGDIFDRQNLVDAAASWIKWVLVAVCVLFGVYVVDKELAIRRLSKALLDEKVMTTALSNRLKELSALADAGKAINSILELDDVLGIILSAALGLLGGTEGSIMLADDDGAYLDLYCYRGSTDRYEEDARVAFGRGIAGRVAETRQPLVISGLPEKDEYPGWVAPKTPIHSAMCVPLVSRGQVLGVLNVNDTEGGRDFTDYDVRTLKLFADHASIAISNARMYEKEKEHVTRLVEVDRLKSEFVATVSHELRTPLTSILGAAATLKRNKKLDDESRTEFLNMIERQGTRLVRLIEDVLFASKIEAGESPLQIEQIDTGSIIREVVLGLQTRAGGDRVSHSLPKEALFAYGDPNAVQQVLFNLVENALKYGGNGPVTVSGADTGSFIEVSVADEGPGIAPEDQEFIFDRFRQVDGSIKRKSVGVGLGLYIVRNLVEGQRGKIRVDSELGQGAKFTFTLPTKPAGRQDDGGGGDGAVRPREEAGV